MSLIDVANATSETLHISPDAESGTPLPTSAPRHGLPVMVNRAQAYYWSHAWQRDEAESMNEIEAGNFVTFADGRSAVRWLLSGDIDDQ